MADKKIEKALYGPSMTEVVFGAVLGLLAGVVAASVYLVFKPVPTVKEMPKEPARGMVYYLPGSDSHAKSKEWENKMKQLLAGTTIEVNEDELNAWMVSLKPPAKPTAAPAAKTPAAGAAPAPAADGYVIPGTPNFRITDGKLQVGLTCTLNWYGLATDVIVQAKGDFRKAGDIYVFTPEKVYLGSCPLHLFPGLAGLLTNHVLEKQKFPDETKAAWAKLGEVSLAGSVLKLSVP